MGFFDFFKPQQSTHTDPYEQQIFQHRINLMESPEQQQALMGALSGEAQDVEGFFQQGIADPARKRYEEETRPAWMSKISNLHSSHRGQMERQGREGLESGLSQQRAMLMEQERQAAMQRQMQAMSGIMGQQMQSPQTVMQDPSSFSTFASPLAALLGGAGFMMPRGGNPSG